MEESKGREVTMVVSRVVPGIAVIEDCINVPTIAEGLPDFSATFWIARHPLREVSAVYDRGVRLSPNQYTVDLQQALLVLRSNPVGEITCDVVGLDMKAIFWPNFEMSGCWTARLGELFELPGKEVGMSDMLPFIALEDPNASQQRDSLFKEAEVECVNSRCQHKAWVFWDDRHSSKCSACQGKAVYMGHGR